MRSTWHFLTKWPLHRRLFQWPRYFRNDEQPDGTGPYSKHQLPEKESSVESVSSHASEYHDPEPDPAEFSAWNLVQDSDVVEAPRVEDPKPSETQTSEPRKASFGDDAQSERNVDRGTESNKVNPPLDAYVSAFEVVRATNQRVLDQVFELNSMRGPLLKQIESLLRTLDGFVHHITDNTIPPDGSNGLAVRVRDLQQQLDTLNNGQFASLQADEARYKKIEDDIIQSLHRSGAYLDHLLQPTSTSPNLNHASFSDSDLSHGQVPVGNGLNEESTDVIRYLTQLGDVDALQESLSELYTERAQLLEEQKSKAKLGVRLDDDSLAFLQSSEREAEVLLEQLEYARLVLEALRQLIDDPDATASSNDDFPVSEVDEDSAELKLLTDSFAAQSLQTTATENGKPALVRRRLQTHDNTFEVVLDSPDDNDDGTALETARFINAWMLKRLLYLPRTLDRLISIVEQLHPGAEPEQLERAFLTHWLEDGSAADFATHRSLADQQTMRANTLSGYLEPKSMPSDTAVPGSSPLLRLGPSVRTAEIIEQAIRFQGLRSSRMSDE
ncbi:hypothetical protein PV04_02169 [Phialophora macrospora]|uniref:Uncharacterized protein n=1 Tax=Phialophora macrospora TaxID=1851006 RepID=A0A0D2CXE5_9EURO|nr:hypothetical protein PV04_02169 [Phialophora macrospora]